MRPIRKCCRVVRCSATRCVSPAEAIFGEVFSADQGPIDIEVNGEATGHRATVILDDGLNRNGSANGLTTTSLQFGIPTLLIVYYAGDINTRYFSTVGDVTEPVLQALGIRYYTLRDRDEVMRTIVGATVLTMDSRRPVAVLLNRDLLRSEA